MRKVPEFKHGLCRFCVRASNCEKAGEGIYSCPEFEESTASDNRERPGGEGLGPLTEEVESINPPQAAPPGPREV